MWANTPLHKAAEAGATGTIALLIENGAIPDITIAYFETPMATAVRAGKMESIRALQNMGVEVNVSTVRAIEKAKARNAGNKTDEWLYDMLPFLNELQDEYERLPAMGTAPDEDIGLGAESIEAEEMETAPEDYPEPIETEGIGLITHPE